MTTTSSAEQAQMRFFVDAGSIVAQHDQRQRDGGRMYRVYHIDQKFCAMFKGTKHECDTFIKQQGLTEVRVWRGSAVDYINMKKIYVG